MLYVKLLGTASGSCALLALAQAVSLSYGSSHKPVTYASWYVLAALLGLTAGACFLTVRRRREQRTPSTETRAEQPTVASEVNASAGDHATTSIFQNSPVTSYHYGDVPSPLRPGDLARRATTRSTRFDRNPEPPLHRAIANGISELETIRRALNRAEETNELQTKTPNRMQRTLGDLLTDQGWHQSRSIMDEAYGACEDFYDRLHVPSRRFEGPMAEMVTPTIEASDKLPDVLEKVERAISELRSRQGSSASESRVASVTFDHVEVGKPRTFRETNKFHESWRGMPVVFDIVNPQGGTKAKAVRPTVTIKAPDGQTLAGPVNARWSTPEAGRIEEVERDIPANGALVGIDTLVQPVAGDRFWLVTDEALRAGLKSSSDPIDEVDVLVTLAIQGENFPKISETVRVRLGFPRPAIGDDLPADTLLPPSVEQQVDAGIRDKPREADVRQDEMLSSSDDEDPGEVDTRQAPVDDSEEPPADSAVPRKRDAAEVLSRRPGAQKSFGLKGDLEAQLEEGYKLLSALKGGIVASWKYDRVPNSDDVHGWSANVEHLLRKEAKLLYLFRWKPLEPNAITSIRAALASALGSSAAVVELERLLVQLEKVIEGL